MRKALFGVAGAAILAMAVPASAAVTLVDASTIQGTLVHSGGLQTATTVRGSLGSSGPLIVNFTGDTTETGGTSDNLMMQQGNGQADVTGAFITTTSTPNDVFNILAGNIFLAPSSGLGIDFIEFALHTGASGTIDFFITSTTLGVTTTSTFEFLNQIIGSGNTFFAFNTSGDTVINNVRFAADSPLQIATIGEVRIGTLTVTGAIPEPGTWVTMLLGFGAIGFSVRRKRRATLLQAI